MSMVRGPPLSPLVTPSLCTPAPYPSYVSPLYVTLGYGYSIWGRLFRVSDLSEFFDLFILTPTPFMTKTAPPKIFSGKFSIFLKIRGYMKIQSKKQGMGSFSVYYPTLRKIFP